MRYCTRRDLRRRAVEPPIDPERVERAIGALYGLLALLHARGDWSDVSAAVRHRKLKLRKQRTYSRVVAHGMGLPLTGPLTAAQRRRMRGIERWERRRGLKD